MVKLELFLLLAFFLSMTGCAEMPDETDIDEIVEEIENEIQEEKDELCGNGFREKWEECDFFNFTSCSEYDESLIGSASCESCEWIVSGCTESSSCRDEYCSGNGTCDESYLYHDIYCKCDEGYEGADCSATTGE